VALIAAIGDDAPGQAARTLWAMEGIDAQAVQVSQASTGAATILLDATGENQIIIIPGANAKLALAPGFTPPADIAVALAQLETPQAATTALFRTLPKARRILNVAPAAPIAPELLAATDMLVLNETEAAILAQREAEPAALALALAAETMRDVIVTAGAAGAFWARPDGVLIDAAPPRVTVADSTGAGDAFLGAFAAFSAEGFTPEKTLRLAVAAGALACTQQGAVPSLPYRAAIMALSGH
jgi:ribokinase